MEGRAAISEKMMLPLLILCCSGVAHAHVLPSARAASRTPSASMLRGGSPAALMEPATAVSSSAVATDHESHELLPKKDLSCRYDHLQIFVDNIQPLSHYKAIEDRLNEFASRVPTQRGGSVDVAAAREEWCKMGPSANPDAYQVHGRDLVEQMLYCFGWRITGQHEGAETRSLLLSTVDPAGVRFVVTCARDLSDGTDGGDDHLISDTSPPT